MGTVLHITFMDKNGNREENSPHIYKSEYNNDNGLYTTERLIEICHEWTKEDADGTVYYLMDNCGREYFV